jgi:hypothetical protein
MIRRTLYGVSWTSCVLFMVLTLKQPDGVGVQLRTWGVPGSVVDVFLASSGVQLVMALSMALLIGYGLPVIISRLMDLQHLRKTNTDIVAALHEQRTLGSIEDLVMNDPLLQPHLWPVTSWAKEQISAAGEPYLALHVRPSNLLTVDQLARQGGLADNNRFLPKLLLATTTIVCLLILSHSSDQAFTEVLSVSGTDYGTMLLGLRSATAAMAIAVFAALLVWSTQSLLDHKLHQSSQTILRNLDKLAVHNDGDTVQLTAPFAMAQSLPNQDTTIELLLRQINCKVDEASDWKLKKATLDNDEKYLSMLAALQQSMAEVQSLRADVDMMNGVNLYQIPVAASGQLIGQSVGRLTSAIKALKAATASELPQL